MGNITKSMILEIECLWHTDETKIQDDAGVDLNPNDLENRTMTFYHIACIAPSKGWVDNIERCLIWIQGDKFISAYSYEETKQMIEKSGQPKL